jgi:GNAT superfamily N-acetyltransferase
MGHEESMTVHDTVRRTDGLHTGGPHIDALAPAEAALGHAMTFPAYRHLLAQQPAKRLPAEPEQRLIQPVVLAARAAAGEPPIALAVAELPADGAPGSSELLSLFVAPDRRGTGIGTALVAAMEAALGARGSALVEAVYTSGKPAIAAIERIFEKRGWTPPELRTISVRFTIQEALSTPWYGKLGLLPPGATIFPWKDLTAAERAHLHESNARSPWIPNSLQPWRHDCIGFDEVSSVGLRYGGEVVGWVINHVVAPRTVRFTCSFMRKDLSRRARIVPLYSEAIRRLSETDCETCTLVTPTVYPEMVQFLRKYCAPYVGFTGETRGTRKALAPA